MSQEPTSTVPRALSAEITKCVNDKGLPRQDAAGRHLPPARPGPLTGKKVGGVGQCWAEVGSEVIARGTQVSEQVTLGWDARGSPSTRHKLVAESHVDLQVHFIWSTRCSLKIIVP